jgi:hypothetical protein
MHSPNPAKGKQMAGSPNRAPTGADINVPSAPAPSFNEVQFDPRGPGTFMTAIKNPVAAIFANEAANAAIASTAKKYPGVAPHNNEADAYRHAVWSHLMTRGIGPELAKKFGDAHEMAGSSTSGAGPNSERLMDLHNNQVGRQLPNDQGQALKEALEKGYLRKRPFGE